MALKNPGGYYVKAIPEADDGVLIANGAKSGETSIVRLADLGRAIASGAQAKAVAVPADTILGTDSVDGGTRNFALSAIEPAVLLRTRAGLLDPNPGAARYSEDTLPGVMAAPPTVTITQTNTPSMASPLAISKTDSRLLFFGNKKTVAPNSNFLWSGDAVSVGAGTVERLPWYIEFMINTAKFDIKTNGQGTQFRLMIDGKWVDKARSNAASIPGNGSNHIITIDFGARQTHRITIEGSSAFLFGGLSLSPTDAIWPSSHPIGPPVCFIGDSFLEAVSGGVTEQGFGTTAGMLLGYRDIRLSASGGTGYRNPGLRVNFQDRVMADVINLNPALAIWTGSLNDTGYNSPTVAAAKAAALSCYTLVKAAKIPQIAVGTFWPGGAPHQGVIDTNLGIKQAAAEAGIPFIDAIVATSTGQTNAGLVTGTGRVGSTTGDGNADWVTSSDTTHPTQDGQNLYGSWLAGQIAAIISAGLL